jgi:hypothetical protein
MNTCKAKTSSGQTCRIKPGPSGFCHLHDMDKKKAREEAKKAAESALVAKSKLLNEVLEIVTKTCEAKGWSWKIANFDEGNCRYATVAIERLISDWERGYFELDVNNNQVKVGMHGNAQSIASLYNSIQDELRKLPWLEKEKRKTSDGGYSFGPKSNMEKLTGLIERFHKVAIQLKRRHDNRKTLIINDEYDVQDLLHAILFSLFDDIRPEEYVPSCAGSCARTDFFLKNEGIIIEVKKANNKLRDKDIGNQLIVDITHYKKHPDCKSLVCFVYDPDCHIRNAAGLMKDLSGKHDNIDVKVIITPK